MGLLDILGAFAEEAAKGYQSADDEDVDFDPLDLPYDTPRNYIISNYKSMHQDFVQAGYGDGVSVPMFRKKKDLDIERLDLMEKAGLSGSDAETQKKLKQLGEDYASRIKQIKPRCKECEPGCIPGSEKCDECYKLICAFNSDMHKLEQMDSYLKSSPEVQQQIQRKQLTKCPVCSAPIEDGSAVCPYCDTDYPADMIGFDMPAGRLDRDAVIAQQAQKTLDEYTQMVICMAENTIASLEDSLLGKLHRIDLEWFLYIAQQQLEFPTSVEKFAQENEVSLLEYVVGVIQEKYKTAYQEQLDRETERTYKYHDIRRKAEMRKLEIEQERIQLMGDHLMRSVPNYGGGGGGGSSYCCGNCIYYIAAERKCLYFNGTSGEYRSGANDSCNNFRSS